MKVTPAKIKANRQNAKKSTGPTTSAGKAASACNSLRHGLLSRKAILADENRSDFSLLSTQLYEDLDPKGALECVIVERLIGQAWRLRRLLEVERAFFSQNDLTSTFCGLLSDQEKRGFQFSMSADGLALLSRYESTLDRSFYRNIHELQRLQASRRV